MKYLGSTRILRILLNTFLEQGPSQRRNVCVRPSELCCDATVHSASGPTLWLSAPKRVPVRTGIRFPIIPAMAASKRSPTPPGSSKAEHSSPVTSATWSLKTLTNSYSIHRLVRPHQALTNAQGIVNSTFLLGVMCGSKCRPRCRCWVRFTSTIVKRPKALIGLPYRDTCQMVRL
jgi:hypothetical protein